jgi:polysaccharide pyruvyl transferase WcaK-like protein
MKNQQHRIALLHHTGCGNLGDDATFAVVIRNIRKRWENAEITAFTMNTDDSAERHGITCYPIRRYQWEDGAESADTTSAAMHTGESRSRMRSAFRSVILMPAGLWNEFGFLARSYSILKSFDLLIVSGGGQLTERGGPWSFPYAVFIWTQMAKRAGVRCMFLNVGAGPLNQPLSRFFVRHALKAADYVSFRDRQSQELAAGLGYTGTSRVFPDNVYGIEVVPSKRRTAEAPPVVGINPMPYPFSDLPKVPANTEEIQDRLIGKMADFAALLVQSSYSVGFFASDIRWDPAEIEHLRTDLLNRYKISLPEYVPITSVDELLGRIAAMDYVVTCRYHGVVFAHLLNKPVLAIAHHPKVTDLMQSIGLSEYCFDMSNFDPARMMDTFHSLAANSRAIKAGMAEKLAENRARSTAQFDDLFASPHSSKMQSAARCFEPTVAIKGRV